MSPRAPHRTPAAHPQKRRRTSQRGATLVEAVLIVQLMLIVTFGIVEAGRLMLAYTTLANAARAGTRYAVVHGSYRKGSGPDGPSGPGNTGNIADVVHGITTAAGLPAANVTVVDTDDDPMYPDGANTVGARVRVKVTYPFSVIVPLVPLPAVTLGSTSEGTICY
jgi:Flp pilus assembly protein TadG